MSPPPEQMYQDLMYELQLGQALYEPDPAGQYDHVRVGDVGYLLRGVFMRLFNVCFDATDNANLSFSGNPPPSTFRRIHEDACQLYRPVPLAPGLRMSSAVLYSGGGTDVSAPASVIPISAGGTLSLECHNNRGAALVIKNSAVRYDAVSLGAFGDHMLTNCDAWLEYANNLGRGIVMRDLILVTGCDLTREWATAVFNKTSLAASAAFQIDAPGASAGAGVWGQWSATTQVPPRTWPTHPPSPVSIVGKPTGIDPYDTEETYNWTQCIFIRGFRVERRARGIGPRVIKGAAEPRDLAKDRPPSPPQPATSVLQDDQSDFELSNLSPNDPQESPGILETVFDYMFQKSGADTVLLHDNDICRIMAQVKSMDAASIMQPLHMPHVSAKDPVQMRSRSGTQSNQLTSLNNAESASPSTSASEENIGDFFAEDTEAEPHYSLRQGDLRRSPSQRSFVSMRSNVTVVSYGILRLPISDVCELIRTRRPLHDAEVVSTECYYRRSRAIYHRFLVLELRRTGKKGLWLRIDRQRNKEYPTLQFLTRLRTPANDLASMASHRETLLNDNDVLENRQLFERNPKLPQLEALLRVMMEELSTYELLCVNPWSFLQEYLGTNGNRGYFTKNGAVHVELSATLRTRIRQAIQRQERVESMDSRQALGHSLPRVKSMDAISSVRPLHMSHVSVKDPVQMRSWSGIQSGRLASFNDTENVSASAIPSQIFAQFQALNHDIREFCDNLAERIGASYSLLSEGTSSTFHEGNPVWKATHEFRSSQDYIYFNMLSIVSTQIYVQIFSPFHPASTDEENYAQTTEYQRLLKIDSAEAGSWRRMHFRSMDADINHDRITGLVQKTSSSIQSGLQQALQLGASEKILPDGSAARLEVTLGDAYRWNRMAKREDEKYSCTPYLIEPGARWDPSRMEPFERLRVPVSRDSRIISPVSLGLMANVVRPGEYVPHVHLKAQVLLEEWFHEPQTKSRPLQSPKLTPKIRPKWSGFWGKNAGGPP